MAMKNLIIILAVLLSTILHAQQPFGVGNLVVVRVGSPDSSLLAGSTAVFLEEFTPTGTHVQTIGLPYTGDNKITLSGRASAEGNLRRSTNKAFLTLGGYNLVPGISSPSNSGTGADRSIARIDRAGNIDLSTILPIQQLYPTAAFRAVISTDGSKYYTAGGTQGLRLVTHGVNDTSILISNTVTNMRAVHIFNDQLYLSHGSGVVNARIMKVGDGIPETDSLEAVGLPGIPNSNSLACDIFFADLSSEVPGNDVLYFADELNGLRKFSLVEGEWVSNGILGSAGDNYRGLTGIELPGGAILFAIKRGGTNASGGGELVRIVDLSGYNETINPSEQLLATATPNTAFRGIALTPQASEVVNTTYIFNGNGNYDNAANWSNGLVPPATLPAGDIIIVNPDEAGICVLNTPQIVSKGAHFIILDGKAMEINNQLDIQ